MRKLPVTVEPVPNADAILKKMDRVVISDSVILDECHSWFNLVPALLAEDIPTAWIIRLDNVKPSWPCSFVPAIVHPKATKPSL